MKVLTAAQMREVDRRTMEAGIPGLVLMENAGHRIVEVMQREFAPLSEQKVVVLCGRGNNGGDGLVVARQLHTRIRPRAMYTVLAAPLDELRGEAAENYRMLRTCGCPVFSEITAEMESATLVVDALLGTGLSGPAREPALSVIRRINEGFPQARVIAVDIPSGMNSDTPDIEGEVARADVTVTFTAPKIAHALPPACDRVGRLYIAPIGSPPELYEQDQSIFLWLLEPARFRHLLGPRPRGAHKGSFGHVLVVGGSRGKTGALAMAGIAALRSGAGLVTVATGESILPSVASHYPELMTEPLAECANGAPSTASYDRLADLARNKEVVALGPGIGTHSDTVALVRRLIGELPLPLVLDADGLNAMAGVEWRHGERLRILTPHPGEMARLTGLSTEQILKDRVAVVRQFTTQNRCILVLKGQRTLIGLPDGRVWINPTGTPALATGGSGDILTGMVAGLLAQAPAEPEAVAAAAVYLHGLAAELGVPQHGELGLAATDILKYLPRAIAAALDTSSAAWI
jgi:NAD(P)H-hydrate epimerase